MQHKAPWFLEVDKLFNMMLDTLELQVNAIQKLPTPLVDGAFNEERCNRPTTETQSDTSLKKSDQD